MKVDRPVIFFDGKCGLCNASVEFLLKQQKSKSSFFIASLQGMTAKTLLPLHYLDSMNSLIFYEPSGHLFIKSSAVINAMSLLKMPWSILRFIKIVPNKILDPIYDLIAKYRYLLWKKKPQCRVPRENERFYFLP